VAGARDGRRVCGRRGCCRTWRRVGYTWLRLRKRQGLDTTLALQSLSASPAAHRTITSWNCYLELNHAQFGSRLGHEVVLLRPTLLHTRFHTPTPLRIDLQTRHRFPAPRLPQPTQSVHEADTLRLDALLTFAVSRPAVIRAYFCCVRGTADVMLSWRFSCAWCRNNLWIAWRVASWSPTSITRAFAGPRLPLLLREQSYALIRCAPARTRSMRSMTMPGATSRMQA
jgi:hypothetical protein